MIELDGKEICIIDAHVHIWNEYKGMRYGGDSGGKPGLWKDSSER